MKSLLPFLIAGVGAHICIFDPPQRGMAPGTMARHPGSRECYVREGPCGPKPAGAPSATYAAGAQFDVIFQQNLNHWNVANPGWVDVAIAPLADADSNDHFRVIASFVDRPAHDMLSVANYTVPVSAPTVPGKYVIRTRYVSNNALEIDPPTNKQAIFYQCSDIEIMPAYGVISSPSAPMPECDLPRTGMYDVLTMDSNGNPYSSNLGYFYYNTDMQVKAWLHPDTNYTTYTDFRSPHPPEYVTLPDNGKCSPWGGDAWYDVTVGPNSGLVPLASRAGSTFWGVPGSSPHSDWDVVWGTAGSRSACRLSWFKAPNGLGYWLKETNVTSPPRMPSNCSSAAAMVGCGGKH